MQYQRGKFKTMLSESVSQIVLIRAQLEAISKEQEKAALAKRAAYGAARK